MEVQRQYNAAATAEQFIRNEVPQANWVAVFIAGGVALGYAPIADLAGCIVRRGRNSGAPPMVRTVFVMFCRVDFHMSLILVSNTVYSLVLPCDYVW